MTHRLRQALTAAAAIAALIALADHARHVTCPCGGCPGRA